MPSSDISPDEITDPRPERGPKRIHPVQFFRPNDPIEGLADYRVKPVVVKNEAEADEAMARRRHPSGRALPDQSLQPELDFASQGSDPAYVIVTGDGAGGVATSGTGEGGKTSVITGLPIIPPA